MSAVSARATYDGAMKLDSIGGGQGSISGPTPGTPTLQPHEILLLARGEGIPTDDFEAAIESCREAVEDMRRAEGHLIRCNRTLDAKAVALEDRIRLILAERQKLVDRLLSGGSR